MQKTLVATNCSRTAGITKPSELGLGEIAIIVDGLISKTVSNPVKKFNIAVGLGNSEYVLSPDIYPNEVSIQTNKVKLPASAKVIVGDDGNGNGIIQQFTVDKLYALDVKMFMTIVDTASQKFTFSKKYIANTKHVDFFTDLLKEKYTLFNHSDKTFIAYLTSSTATVSTVTGAGFSFVDGMDYVTAVSVAGCVAGDFLKVDGKLYKIKKVNSVNKTLLLEWPYRGSNKKITNGTIVTYDTLIGADYKKVGLVIEGIDSFENPIYSDYYKAVPKIQYQEGFNMTECREDYGCHPVGIYTQVQREMYMNIKPIHTQEMTEEIYRKMNTLIKEGNGYSVITLQINKLAKGASTVAVQNSSINVYLDRGTIANIALNNASTTFSTSISENTGLGDVANSTSFINVLNSIMVKHGVFEQGVNVRQNGGKELSATGVVNSSIDI